MVSFVLIDLAGYTKHVLSHRVNYFWNEHVVHHSSEEFNLACALRQTISDFFSIQGILLIPAAILGMPPEVVAIISPLHLFLQFWYHTRHIGKLGWLEYIIVTPSQHRVHHAINPEYLDKNMGQIFPWWDRIFGTFQEELDDIPCIYGTKKPAATWNPIIINFQHLWQLIKDAWRTESWSDKFRIWFKPTGWRPADVAQLYPVSFVEKPELQTKYDSAHNSITQYWSWIQLVMSHAFLIYMLLIVVKIDFMQLSILGSFILLHIGAYTSIMDNNRAANFWEFGKLMLGIFITIQWSWFSELTWISIAVGVYLGVSAITTVYLTSIRSLEERLVTS